MSDLRAYAQLVRLSNLPTALADICLGVVAANALPEHGLAFVLLLLASACLYSAGMVWNDYFDREQDRRERPFRPLAIRPRRAGASGTTGDRAAHRRRVAGAAGRENRPADRRLSGRCDFGLRWLAQAHLGRPVGDGDVSLSECVARRVGVRFAAVAARRHLAAIVGLYIVGVTWFARTEAHRSKQNALRGAAAVMLASLILALPLPVFLPEGQHSSLLFPYLLVALGFWVGGPVVQAIGNPAPAFVQAAVQRALMALILLDAVLATATAGSVGLLILLLLAPSLYLNRKSWLYAT